MKKRILSVAMSVLTLASVTAMSGCFGGGGNSGGGGILGGFDNPIIENIDTKKTQIYVHNYNGGYGDEWLKDAKKRFETLYANWEGDNGKVGVQVYIDNSKNNNTFGLIANNCKTSRDQVWFTQGVPYHDLVAQGVMYDITDVVTEKLSKFGEEKTIVSKMNTGMETYLNVNEHYYAIPHYESFPVITYDKDVFAKYKLYYADNVDDSDNGFIPVANARKAAGLDKQYGTEDDGLPTTWDEFYKLCDRMLEMSVTPFLWSGLAAETYYSYVTTAARVNWDGYNTEYARYSLTGEVSGLVDVDANGNITPYNGTGTATITPENAYVLTKSEGSYYGLLLAEKIITNKWYSPLSMQTTKSHTDAQTDYVMSSLEGSPIAMLIDGSWWECEASQGFQLAVETFGKEDGSKENRNFGVMSFPTKDASGKQTYAEINQSQAFINAYAMKGKSEKEIELVKDFMAFAYTDESLVQYTKITGTPRGLNYEMPETTLSEMSSYARSLWKMKKSADIVYPYSANDVYKANSGALAPAHGIYWTAQCPQDTYATTILAFHRSTKKATAIEYFNGTYTYAKNNWLVK